MRWAAKPVRHWRPGFAFFPLRDGERMVWLEPIWTRFCGYYSEWMPWEARPNDPLPAQPHDQQVEGTDPGRNPESSTEMEARKNR